MASVGPSHNQINFHQCAASQFGGADGRAGGKAILVVEVPMIDLVETCIVAVEIRQVDACESRVFQPVASSIKNAVELERDEVCLIFDRSAQGGFRVVRVDR